jgi:hypothetical protein
LWAGLDLGFAYSHGIGQGQDLSNHLVVPP